MPKPKPLPVLSRARDCVSVIVAHILAAILVQDNSRVLHNKVYMVEELVAAQLV